MMVVIEIAQPLRHSPGAGQKSAAPSPERFHAAGISYLEDWVIFEVIYLS
jgi:hypothetical protein